jgi:hypothetical protein
MSSNITTSLQKRTAATPGAENFKNMRGEA